MEFAGLEGVSKSSEIDLLSNITKGGVFFGKRSKINLTDKNNPF